MNHLNNENRARPIRGRAQAGLLIGAALTGLLLQPASAPVAPAEEEIRIATRLAIPAGR